MSLLLTITRITLNNTARAVYLHRTFHIHYLIWGAQQFPKIPSGEKPWALENQRGVQWWSRCGWVLAFTWGPWWVRYFSEETFGSLSESFSCIHSPLLRILHPNSMSFSHLRCWEEQQWLHCHTCGRQTSVPPKMSMPQCPRILSWGDDPGLYWWVLNVTTRVFRSRRQKSQSPRSEMMMEAEVKERLEYATLLALKVEEGATGGRMKATLTRWASQENRFSPRAFMRKTALLSPGF